jgi:hypothetical protein
MKYKAGREKRNKSYPWLFGWYAAWEFQRYLEVSSLEHDYIVYLVAGTGLSQLSRASTPPFIIFNNVKISMRNSLLGCAYTVMAGEG